MWSENEVINQLGYSIGGRYYAFKQKQMNKGFSGNNCNGSYFSFMVSDLIGVYSIRNKPYQENDIEYKPELYRGLMFNIKPEIGIGFQQKIKRSIYFDTSISTNYDVRFNKFGFSLSFLFGGLVSIMN